MPATEELLIIVRLRDAATRGLRSIGRSVQGTRRLIGGLSSAVFSLQGALVGIGAGLAARQFLQVANSFEQMEIKLDQLTRGRGRETLDEINEWAKTMPVNTEQAVQAFISMQAFGLDPTIEKMEILTDVATIMGQDALPRVSRALGQMAALGKVSAEELNQLSEVGINAREILADAFGMTVEELQRSGKDINEVIDAIWLGLQGQFGGAAARAQDTWQGLVTILISYWTDFAKEVSEAGVFDFLKAALKELVDLVQELERTGELDEIIAQTAQGILTSLEVIAKAVAVVADAWWGWRLIWLSLKTIYADFAAFINDVTADVARAIDTVLTTFEEALNAVGRGLQRISEASGGLIEFGFAENLADLDSMSTTMDGIVGSLEDGVKFWQDISEESGKQLRDLAGQESAWSRVNTFLDRINAKAKAAVEERRRLEAEPRAPVEAEERRRPEAVASGVAQAQAELTRFQAEQATILAELESGFEASTATLDQVYDQRRRIIEEGTRLEIELLRQREAAAVRDPSKQLQIQAQIFAQEQELQRELLSLERQKQEAILAEEQRQTDLVVEEKRRRIRELQAAETGGEAGLQARFQQELIELDQRHAEELQRLRDLNASKAEIEDAFRVQQLERDRLAAEQRKQLFQSILDAAGQVTGGVANAFKDLYEAGGRQSKTFFRIYKAAAIAQAIIDTYKSATAAFSALAGIPYVGPALGAAAAAAAIAAGIARVATIRQQQFGAAEGGLATTAGVITSKVVSSTIDKQTIEKLIGAVPDRKMVMGTFGKFADGGQVVHTDNGRSYVVEDIRNVISNTKKSIKSQGPVVRSIVNKTFQSGGPIQGSSPHPKADNIPIMVTAGEFVHPVDAVKHYGLGAMEAIRKKVVPREILSQFNLSVPTMTKGFKFQAGGAVPTPGVTGAGVSSQAARSAAAGGAAAQQAAEERINITNVTDPNLMGEFLQSRPGEQQILNIISENKQLVRNSLFNRDG